MHEKLLEGKSIGSLLSEYANSGYKAQLYTEVIAESFSVKNINSVASDLIKLLEKEVKGK